MLMPTSALRLELAPRSDGARYRSVTLSLERDGGLLLTSQERGGSELAVWGFDDEEVTVQVPADHAARLVLALLAERLPRDRSAVEALASLCEQRGLTAHVACWT
jgi:hypothetical protein